MKITIRNIAGSKKIDFDAKDKINLIQGHNGNGKSWSLRAIEAAFSGSFNGFLKKDYHLLLSHSEKLGACSVKTKDGEASIAIPSGAYNLEGIMPSVLNFDKVLTALSALNVVQDESKLKELRGEYTACGGGRYGKDKAPKQEATHTDQDVLIAERVVESFKFNLRLNDMLIKLKKGSNYKEIESQLDSVSRDYICPKCQSSLVVNRSGLMFAHGNRYNYEEHERLSSELNKEKTKVWAHKLLSMPTTEYDLNEAISQLEEIKRDVLNGKLYEIHKQIQAEEERLSSERTKPDPITVSLQNIGTASYEDGIIRLNGIPYNMLSLSEQWRARLLLATRFADVILVDALDIINPQERLDILKGLEHTENRYIITCTLKEKVDVYNSIWIEKGEVK